MRRGMWALIILAVFPLSVFAGSLPQNYTVKEHSYMWRADGNSATQGTGSIVNYPTITSGTATAILSQVTTADVPAIPTASGTLPGTGSFIKVVASGGASGGNINVEINCPAISQGIEAFLRRADELAAKYGAGFALDTRAREALKKFQPTY